ncbi:MAG: efflux RND transporter periplasmic adaptor subunit [Deltaproteobacteria bacterium]|nr:efflux RND transporter periplasmic adaptor subunit [Deltaproteobacteria bacterium]
MNKKGTTGKTRGLFPVVVSTIIVTLVVAGAGAYLLGFLGPREERGTIGKTASDQAPAAQDIDKGAPENKKVLYWRAPMNPNEIYDKPGKSAMGMDLVPVYEDDSGAGTDIKIDPVIQQNMGIRTDVVKKGPLVHAIRTYGHITPDETRTVQVSLKTSGWIEKLYADFEGKYVEKGEALFEIYSPDLIAAQEEYLIAYRSPKRNAAYGRKDLLAPALRRLRYFDVPEGEIREIEKSGIAEKSRKIISPFSGFVIQKDVEEGIFVKAGTTVLRIADLSKVWVEAHIYEYELPWIQEGQTAEMTLSYLPGKVFSGKVSYVYPYVQPKTRDVVIRLEFENPALELKPDMYCDVLIKADAGKEGLIIPSEAVIRSGERNSVFVARGQGKFTLRDVILGPSLDEGKVQVLVGLAEGEPVVTSGQFLLDSESKLKEAVRKMMDAERMEKQKKEEEFFEDLEK